MTDIQLPGVGGGEGKKEENCKKQRKATHGVLFIE
jgi:hypothetical protein